MMYHCCALRWTTVTDREILFLPLSFAPAAIFPRQSGLRGRTPIPILSLLIHRRLETWTQTQLLLNWEDHCDWVTLKHYGRHVMDHKYEPHDRVYRKWRTYELYSTVNPQSLRTYYLTWISAHSKDFCRVLLLIGVASRQTNGKGKK